MKPIIEVKNISKKYKIKESLPYQSLRDSIATLFRAKKIRDENTHMWALKNVSFQVMPGEVLGVIGRNGAGKSTLLKILTQITSPTEGEVRLRGRVASLLEVGTGFHPELTGRENIYLNGAILGMSRQEVKRKFDEIVDFAEIEKFLDTPVKHYSSGMYMRLAFAVAAHLEPEILLVDEVLAVGDTEFQKKCLGKMKNISENGRTIIFVSHNLGVVKQLCFSGIVLFQGKVIYKGKINYAIDNYINSFKNLKIMNINSRQSVSNSEAYIKNIRLVDNKINELSLNVAFQYPFNIEVSVIVKKDIEAVLGIAVKSLVGETITTFHTVEIGETGSKELTHLHKGINTYLFEIPQNLLRPGNYYIGCSLFNRKLIKNFDHIENCFAFQVNEYNDRTYFSTARDGIFFYNNIKIRKIN